MTWERESNWRNDAYTYIARERDQQISPVVERAYLSML